MHYPKLLKANQIIQTRISLSSKNGERVIQGRVSKFFIAGKVEFHSRI